MTQAEHSFEPLGDPRLTEAQNPRTVHIDRSGTLDIVRLIQQEDLTVPQAVVREAPAIADLIDRVTQCLRAGGRLFYIGAGTSGRLGVLDASECPPTFGTEPSLVQGIIAGGREAMFRSQEGAEDDREAGRAAVLEAEIGPRDFVLGIATSGTTPYVHAALEAARERGAATGFLACTPPVDRMREVADILVTPLVGPEVIAGSTRMKAGTATKLVLNTLSTGVMIRLGKVYTNLMVDLHAVSDKLVDRSIRIVCFLCDVEREMARHLLATAGGSAKTAVAMCRLGATRWEAERLLDQCDGFLGEVLERFGGSRDFAEYSGYPADFTPEEARLLLTRLREAPARLRVAVAESVSGPGTPTGASITQAAPPGEWTAAQHVAHLLQFETEAIGARLARLVTEEFPHFGDWSPSQVPPQSDRPPAELLEGFELARARSLAAIPASSEPFLRREAWIGQESCSVWQFLRGVAHHDDAHIRRIAGRIHPSLLVHGAPGG